MDKLIEILDEYAYSIAIDRVYSRDEQLRRLGTLFDLGLGVAKNYSDKEAIDYFGRLSALFKALCVDRDDIDKTKEQDKIELRHGDFVKYGIPSGSVYSLAKRRGIRVNKRDNANVYSLTREQYGLLNEYIGKRKSKRAK